MYLLRRILKSPRSKRQPEPNRINTLPYEIWELILEFVLQELRHPYLQCNWLTFPNYIQKRTKSTAVDITDWKSCRLVCRAFAETIKTQIQFVKTSGDASIPEGISVLRIKLNAMPGSSMRTLTASYSTSRHITSLTLELEEGYRSLITLMNKSESLPNLRSLTISGNFPSDLWKPLAQSFPSLIELWILNTVECEDPVTLRDLEILRVGGIKSDCSLVCPKLKHLFVQGRLEWNKFLQIHAKNLESFLSRYSVQWFHRADIRPLFTSLRTYGEAMPSYSAYQQADPQSIPYPEHLCFYPPYYIPTATSHLVVKEIPKWANVRFVTMYLPMLIPEEANALAEACEKRGGKLLPFVHQ